MFKPCNNLLWDALETVFCSTGFLPGLIKEYYFCYIFLALSKCPGCGSYPAVAENSPTYGHDFKINMNASISLTMDLSSRISNICKLLC